MTHRKPGVIMTLMMSAKVFSAVFLASLACGAGGREEIDAPGCSLELSFAPELRAEGLRAVERINAATGCSVAESGAGVPVYVEPGMLAADGDPVCGGTYISYYRDGAVAYIEGIGVSDSRGKCNSIGGTLVHEVFHAMTTTPGLHSESGVFAEFSGFGESINESTLSAVCSHIDCPAFVPEP